MNISPFGKVDPENVKEYYDGNIKVGDENIEIDLNFESESISENLLVSVVNLIAQIKEFADIAWKAVSHDWDLDEESETARFYLQHHLEEFDEDEIIKLFGTTEIDKQTFIDALSLVRIGLYPEDEDMFAVFDIQFSQELTDYLMSVSLNQSGQVTGISFES
ncbi:DUF2004 domain-containing protein [Alkalimarinus sediminis]|uniref:DUF2004 domain-containing protein n=1 Tax=Alkalimarinus sediminis TaxID=1632866 RepID=A0A9E8HN55_9ALTE|nr:DUF2004 domain-containing protein [Alkalimarinus sediminis]UZW76347.1 DUF2004 domain-containing protein [Alkalimarinus sediminis]